MPHTKTIIISHVIKASSLRQKITGLLGTSQAKPMYFQTRWGIHTFGMKYPIDVLILDDNFVVKKMKEKLVPWRVFIWNPTLHHVVELPSGTIRQLHIQEDTIINIHAI